MLQIHWLVREWAPMSIGKNQITGSFVATNISIEVYFYAYKNYPYDIYKKICGSMYKKWTVRKKFMDYLSKKKFLYVTLPSRNQCRVPIIRFVPNTLHQILDNFTVSSPGYSQTGCLWWEAVESWFHLDSKSFFAFKNNSVCFSLGHIVRLEDNTKSSNHRTRV